MNETRLQEMTSSLNNSLGCVEGKGQNAYIAVKTDWTYQDGIKAFITFQTNVDNTREYET